MTWVTSESGHRCTRHATSFARGEVCQQCVSDPGPVLIAGDSSSDLGDLNARITALRTKASSLWSVYEDRIDGDDSGVAIKAVAEMTKILRLAEELQDRSESREHDLKLINHEREMSGLRRNN